MYPIGPISQASLLQIHVEKVRAISQRYDVRIPLFLMTSPATHEDTVQFVKENDRFGLGEEDLVIFCQGTMPAVDIESGKLLLAGRGQLFLSPDGHGGTVAALGKSGALDQMRERGIEQLFYLQVDNPLVPICDPLLIGHHLEAESELTSLTVKKKHALEKWGNFAMIDGKMHVIEYSDLPTTLLSKPTIREISSSGLAAWQSTSSNAPCSSEHSIWLKCCPFMSRARRLPASTRRGSLSHRANPMASSSSASFSTCCPYAERPLVVEYREEDCFAPLKNAPGAKIDTPDYVRLMLLEMHKRWLTAAGAVVGEGVDVEISPLFAPDAEGVASKLGADSKFLESTYLQA